MSEPKLDTLQELIDEFLPSFKALYPDKSKTPDALYGSSHKKNKVITIRYGF